LRSLRREATGTEQAPYVIRMVDDIEVLPDEIDDASTRPQAGAIAGHFWPGDDQARQAPPLRGAELRRPPGGRPSPQARPALSSVGPFPSPDGAPIHTEAVRHHMNRDVTLKQFDGTESSLLELSRAPLWAHGVPPHRGS
jgi:hypothetical protein